jgi:Activator of Hsp90 ATPase homolog 1-like protein
MEAGMGFPDRIERTLELAHPPAAVWAALTTAEGLNAWFGHQATIDLRPGGSAHMTWPGGDTAEMRIERVEEPTAAGTRLTVVETGFAQLPDDAYRKALDSNIEGWASELGELADYLDAA